MTRIAYYLRNCGNLHYFAALKPYLDHFLRRDCENHVVVRDSVAECDEIAEYEEYRHLFSANRKLDSFELVLTPTHLREQEIGSRANAVQIFHGMSDKPFTYERDFSGYKLCLCVGQRQLDRLMHHLPNRAMRWAMVGYPKFDHVPSLPALFANGKKTVIYCPTWRKGGLSSIERFFAHPQVIASLAGDYNVIVKPHPNLFNSAREFYDPEIVELLQRIPGITLVRSGNVMPWFAQADLFLGDISASGYEWLYFAKPMVFLNPQPQRLRFVPDIDSVTYLWQCGEVCDDVNHLKRCVDDALTEDKYRDGRERVLNYSVHHPRDGSATARGVAQIEALLSAAECVQ